MLIEEATEIMMVHIEMPSGWITSTSDNAISSIYSRPRSARGRVPGGSTRYRKTERISCLVRYVEKKTDVAQLDTARRVRPADNAPTCCQSQWRGVMTRSSYLVEPGVPPGSDQIQKLCVPIEKEGVSLFVRYLFSARC